MDIVKYSQTVNEATREYFQGDFTQSSNLYLIAFEDFKIPFASDLINCFYNHKLGGLDHKNNEILEQLFKKCSMSISQLSEILPIESLSKTQYQYLINNKAQWPSTINHELRKAFDQLMDNRVHYSNSQIANRFVAMCLEQGFPNEDNCGLFIGYEKPIWTSLRLIYSHGLKSERRNEMLDLLNDAFNNGQVPSQVYGYILDYDHHNNEDFNMKSLYLASTITQVDGNWYKPFIYYEDEILNEIESNRSRIGLESIEVVQKYIVCNKLCSDMFSINFSDNIIEDVPAYFVKEAFLIEGLNLENYKIDFENFRSRCKCN